LGRDLHLILEAHVVLYVLPGHADVVGDLVELVALLGARQEPVPRRPWMVGWSASSGSMSQSYFLTWAATHRVAAARFRSGTLPKPTMTPSR
jgi:poly(3-hydroxybutyrate) depolymerase